MLRKLLSAQGSLVDLEVARLWVCWAVELRYVVQDCDGRSAFSLTASGGNIDAVELLLEHSPSLSSQDHRQMTPLMHAIEAGHVEVAQRMLDSLRDQ